MIRFSTTTAHTLIRSCRTSRALLAQQSIWLIAVSVVGSLILFVPASVFDPPGEATGACCLPTGQCVDNTTSIDCTELLAGTYQGDGSNCFTSLCPLPDEACCFPDDTCQNLDPDACFLLGGQPMGAGTDCITQICATCPADCAAGTPDGNVNVTDLLALLANWGGTPVLCDIAPPGGDGTVNVTDLLALLAAWGACP